MEEFLLLPSPASALHRPGFRADAGSCSYRRRCRFFDLCKMPLPPAAGSKRCSLALAAKWLFRYCLDLGSREAKRENPGSSAIRASRGGGPSAATRPQVTTAWPRHQKQLSNTGLRALIRPDKSWRSILWASELDTRSSGRAHGKAIFK